MPNNFVPLAAQSLDEPVPYSLPPITTKSVPLFYIQQLHHILALIYFLETIW